MMDLSFASSLLLLALCVAYAYCTPRRRSQSLHRRLPPAPPGWPLIGHLHLLTEMPHHALAELSRSMRAPLLRLRLGTVPVVVISKPELARAALTTHDAALSSRPDLLSGRVLSFGCSDVTYAPSGPYHRAARRVLVSELLSARRVEACAGVRAEEVSRLLAHLSRRHASSPAAPPVDLGKCFLNLANDVLCHVAFGRRFLHGKRDRLGAVVEDVNELFGWFSIADCFPELGPVVNAVTGLRHRLRSSGADLRKFCDDVVDEHISGKRQCVSGDRDECFIDVLLGIHKSLLVHSSSVRRKQRP